MKRLTFAFENLGRPTDPNRGPAIVARELRALANNVNHDEGRQRPKVIGLCEAIGHRLPTLDHYGRPLTDHRRAGRANLALYVRDDLEHEVRWVDLVETWPRTKGPGPHPARSILVASVEDWRVIVGHAPPLVPGSAAPRFEWLNATARLMNGHTFPIAALTDPNELGDELREHTGAWTDGTPYEAVHVVDAILADVHTPNAVNGVPILSDHKRALIGKARSFVRE